jgi:hypothetical protein
MDQSKMLKRLETACRHVGEGEQVIAKQQGLIAALRVQGREIDGAMQLLYQLESWSDCELKIGNIYSG